MNAQTPGPLHVTRHRTSHSIRAKDDGGTFDVANTGLLNVPPFQDEANAALLAAAYTAFDKAGRELGIDAAELARTIPLAEVIRYALDYAQLHTAAHNRGDVGRPDQVKAAQITLNKLAKQLVLIQ